MTLPKFIRACLCMATSIILASCGGGSGGSGGSSGSTVPTTLFSLSGTVTGLATGDNVVFQVVVSNNGNTVNTTPTATIKGDGTFITPPFVPSGGSFIVLVATQPSGQICTVSNGAGTNVTADVTNISVVCSATTYSVSVTTAGLLPGQQLVVLNNSADPLTITANGTSTFVTPIASGGGYDITVKTAPLVTTCTIANSTASNVTANVTDISLTCGPAYTDAWQYSFGSTSGDASQPEVGLVQGSDHMLYGVAGLGGSIGAGAIYKIATAGGSDNVIYNFGSVTGDGGCPQASLIQAADGNFYGTTCLGGAYNTGTIYQVTPAGVETVIHSFSLAAEGGYPYGALVQTSDGSLYGTTSVGGLGGNGYGTVFKINTSGSVFSVVYAFGTGGVSDAKNPHAALVMGPDGNLYGTSVNGGDANVGTVYQLNLSTQSIAVIHNFGHDQDGNMNPPVTPHHDQSAALVLNSDGYFYGTTPTGGTSSSSAGVVFKIDTLGTGYSVLYNFAALSSTDGQNSRAALLLANDGAFYGTTVSGGVYNGGTIFRVTSTGVENVMYSFGSGDGEYPVGALIQANDGHLYGTTFYGGQFNQGIVFKF